MGCSFAKCSKHSGYHTKWRIVISFRHLADTIRPIHLFYFLNEKQMPVKTLGIKPTFFLACSRRTFLETGRCLSSADSTAWIIAACLDRRRGCEFCACAIASSPDPCAEPAAHSQ